MIIRRIAIQNYRGIRSLTWNPVGRLICLIGHGDSTKTTILDAIDLTLSPRWGVQLSETDFFDLDTATAITIEITVGDLPEPLLDGARAGLFLRGWDLRQTALNDEPEGDDELVVTVRFEGSADLDVSWRFATDWLPEGKTLSNRDRELLGVAYLGSEVNRHLSWGRLSALTRATEMIGTVKRALVESHQAAKQSIRDSATLQGFNEAAGKAESAARGMGALVRDKYRASLLPYQGASSYGALGLHDGSVPLSAQGLGNRRLTALGLQRLAVPDGGIVLVDEIEAGLEPHRLRHLLKILRPAGTSGQAYFTTHSPVALIELNAPELSLVRSRAGVTTVQCLSADLQDMLRKMPEAFLGHRILVAEGRTELGLCRGFEGVWENQHKAPLTDKGCVVVDGGGGPQARRRAAELARLGFLVGLIVDSDDPGLDVGESWQAESSVKVFTWPGSLATEERLAQDLSWERFLMMVEFALRKAGAESVRARVSGELKGTPELPASPAEWLASSFEPESLRAAFGRAAKRKGAEWFKDLQSGEWLGELAAADLAEIATKPLGTVLKDIGTWFHAG